VGSFNEVYLCMEYMDYTLHRLIHSQQVPLTEQMIQFILYQLFSAINYMHSVDIIHRDMKPENILINKKLELKLADMNLARKEIITEEATYYVTTRPYRAPEIFISVNTYTKAIDIWSIGCILAEMLGKTVLFQGKDYVDQLRRFVAILGKPTLEIFPDLDPVTLQGLNKVFKDIPDREKVDWKFLFPKVLGY
jgi:serine/threonine protein kinase